MLFVGRQRETKILQEIWDSQKPEFVALYGRRRVGKTYLIRNFFKDKSLYLEVVGRKNGKMHEQLDCFHSSLQQFLPSRHKTEKPANWHQAFEQLNQFLKKNKASKKILVFLDELPWLATPRSGLLQELDHYWNSHWSTMPHFKLVVCGSAASWMLDKLIHAKGGLYNRVTKAIKLSPFTLAETQEFLEARKIHWGIELIAELYMIIGGIPFYLDQVSKGLSPAQVVNELCFNEQGLLYDEFSRLFSSLFLKSETHISIIKEIAKKRQGISRQDLSIKTGLSSGGAINRPLSELGAADFIQTYHPYGKTTKFPWYKLVDEYVLFYLYWIEKLKKTSSLIKEDHWLTMRNTTRWASWAGYCFENLCQKHVKNILLALGISGIACTVGAWQHIPKKGSRDKGAQIDLLFDRADNIISLCEIKHSISPYTITKSYANELRNKLSVFRQKTKTRKTLSLVMISTHGLNKNSYSDELITNSVVLKDLF